MLDQLNEAASRIGGKWVKLRDQGDVLEGVVLDFELREKSYEGQPVVSRSTGKPRIEWLFTIQTELREDAEDDGIRKFPANESAQRAIAAAIKECGQPAKKGDHLKVGVKTPPKSTTDQAEYQARWTSAAEELQVPTAPEPEVEVPF